MPISTPHNYNKDFGDFYALKLAATKDSSTFENEIFPLYISTALKHSRLPNCKQTVDAINKILPTLRENILTEDESHENSSTVSDFIRNLLFQTSAEIGSPMRTLMDSIQTKQVFMQLINYADREFILLLNCENNLSAVKLDFRDTRAILTTFFSLQDYDHADFLPEQVNKIALEFDGNTLKATAFYSKHGSSEEKSYTKSYDGFSKVKNEILDMYPAKYLVPAELIPNKSFPLNEENRKRLVDNVRAHEQEFSIEGNFPPEAEIGSPMRTLMDSIQTKQVFMQLINYADQEFILLLNCENNLSAVKLDFRDTRAILTTFLSHQDYGHADFLPEQVNKIALEFDGNTLKATAFYSKHGSSEEKSYTKSYDGFSKVKNEILDMYPAKCLVPAELIPNKSFPLNEENRKRLVDNVRAHEQEFSIERNFPPEKVYEITHQSDVKTKSSPRKSR